RLRRYSIVNALRLRMLKTVANHCQKIVQMNPGKPLITTTETGAKSETIQGQQSGQHATRPEHHTTTQNAQSHAITTNVAGGLLPGIAEQIGKITAHRRTGFGQLHPPRIAVKTHGGGTDEHRRTMLET